MACCCSALLGAAATVLATTVLSSARIRPPSTPPQGEGSGATGRGSTKLPLQKRQELLQQQAQAPLKQVRGRGGGSGRRRMDALPGCVYGGDMWQLMRASHSTLLGCGAGARP